MVLHIIVHRAILFQEILWGFFEAQEEIQEKKVENLCTNADKGVTDAVTTFLAVNVTFKTLILILTLSYTLKWYALESRSP